MNSLETTSTKTDMNQSGSDSSGSESLAVLDVGLIYETTSGTVEALRNVSLNVRDGEFISIVGPSGCGKSSLLKLVLGLQDPTHGEIRIAGTKITGPTRHAGCVFQSPVLLPWRTIKENVLLPVDVMALDRSSATARADHFLKLVGLGGFEERYPFELSGGMQQRAAIVRALVHDPRLLIMDEPFAALDALTREQLSIELQRVWMESRKTVVFITHSISEAVFLSDRIIVMSARPGRIVAEYHNPYPRPRNFDSLNSPELGKLMTDIRASLDRAST
jgi:NitT/TauT family transport system ATP-binding protein